MTKTWLCQGKVKVAPYGTNHLQCQAGASRSSQLLLFSPRDRFHRDIPTKCCWSPKAQLDVDRILSTEYEKAVTVDSVTVNSPSSAYRATQQVESCSLFSHKRTPKHSSHSMQWSRCRPLGMSQAIRVDESFIGYATAEILCAISAL